MMRSMFAGVSGLRSHQTKMDVIGNNIANVNTFGYKSSRANFEDALSQYIRGASAPQDGRGGTNALQVGLGVNIASIDVNHTQGNLQSTGKASDIAIQGDGFFVVSDGVGQYYTRAGSLRLESSGYLSVSNGLLLQGWMADTSGNINTNAPIESIMLPIGQNISPSATTMIEFGGNLDSGTTGTLSYPELTIDDGAGNYARVSFILTPTANYNEFNYKVSVANGTVTAGTGTGTITLDINGNVTAVTGASFEVTPDGGNAIQINSPNIGESNGGAFTVTGKYEFAGTFEAPTPLITSTKVYDSQGKDHTITTTVTKTAVNTWSWKATDEYGTSLGEGSLSFDTNGQLVSAPGTAIVLTPSGANPLTITPDFSGVTQFASSLSEITSPYQDGFAMGQLQSFNIDNDGKIIGVFSNGRSQTLAQLAIANFTNASGLVRMGNSLFGTSANSGNPQIGPAGLNGRGDVTPGNLEMSNVDLAEEFTDMIVTQRGFQANSRIITTSDEMLQELVSLKR